MQIRIFKDENIIQGMKFVCVGVLNTVIGYGSYYICLAIGINYIVSLCISSAIGITHSFFWNRYWTFKSNGKMKIELVKFISVYAVSFFINLGILALLVEKYKIDERIAGLYTLIIVTVISYFGHKFWSFKR